jgi:hypothetical protein
LKTNTIDKRRVHERSFRRTYFQTSSLTLRTLNKKPGTTFATTRLHNFYATRELFEDDTARMIKGVVHGLS